jgi:hypothetical protein
MRWAARVTHNSFLVGTPEGKRPLARWDDNIKVDFEEIGGADCIYLAEDKWWAVVKMIINFHVP